METNLKISFTTEENMFAYVFRFGLRHTGRKLVVAEDDIIRKELVGYLAKRRATVAENKNVNGFCIYKSIPDDTTAYSCLSEICLHEYCASFRTTEIPSVIVALDPAADEPDNFWKSAGASKRYDYPRVQCFLMNSELKPVFLNTFAIAEKEIDLICPWINRHVVNEKFISLLHEAISRGVKIKIKYGIGTDSSDVRQKTSEDTVEMLKSRFSGTNLLEFKKGNTHIKYLICDDKYMMCGSYNFLSFTADYEDTDERDEGMEYIVDKSQIAVRRRQLFS